MEIKQKGKRKHLNDAQPGSLRKSHVQRGDLCRDAEGDHEHDESQAPPAMRADTLPVAMPAMGITTTSANAAGSQRQAGRGGVISQQLLHELRLQNGVGVQHAAHQHHEKTTYGEVLESE